MMIMIMILIIIIITIMILIMIMKITLVIPFSADDVCGERGYDSGGGPRASHVAHAQNNNDNDKIIIINKCHSP